MRCPKCFGVVENVVCFNRDSKHFSSIDNWKYCPSCKGQILTKDCKGIRRKTGRENEERKDG